MHQRLQGQLQNDEQDISNTLVRLRMSSRRLLPRQACKVFFTNPRTRAEIFIGGDDGFLRVRFIYGEAFVAQWKEVFSCLSGGFCQECHTDWRGQCLYGCSRSLIPRHAHRWSQGGMYIDIPASENCGGETKIGLYFWL